MCLRRGFHEFDEHTPTIAGMKEHDERPVRANARLIQNPHATVFHCRFGDMNVIDLKADVVLPAFWRVMQCLRLYADSCPSA